MTDLRLCLKVVLQDFQDNSRNHASVVSQRVLGFLPGELWIPFYEGVFEEYQLSPNRLKYTIASISQAQE